MISKEKLKKMQAKILEQEQQIKELTEKLNESSDKIEQVITDVNNIKTIEPIKTK